MLHDPVDDAFLDAAGEQLRVVANVAVGYDNVDLDAARRHGVTITNTPGVLTDATADLAIALLLAITRRIGEGERRIRSGEPWAWAIDFMLGRGLRGKTLGIVGYGEIGRATAQRARAFGMEIVYTRRSPSGDPAQVELDELLERSHAVSLHCPLTPETRHLIDADALARMRDDAYLVNTARGPVVDEAALAAALRDGVIAGAALDVFEREPEVHPGLLGLENAVLVPHLGLGDDRDPHGDGGARGGQRGGGARGRGPPARSPTAGSFEAVAPCVPCGVCTNLYTIAAVSFLLTCPNCGIREVTDFGYGGEVTVRPAVAARPPRAQHVQLLPPQRRGRPARVVVPPLRLPRVVPRRARHDARTRSGGRRCPTEAPAGDPAARRSPGERIDRGRPISFTFDGKAIPAFEGDTIASALYAVGPAHVQPLVQVPPPARRAVRLRPVRELARADRRPPRRARVRRAGASTGWRWSTRTRSPGSTST